MRDGDALDILARRFKEAGEDGEVNGGDLVELVSEMLTHTGRATNYTAATVANMREFEERHGHDRRCIAYAPISQEEASASSGDYFALAAGEVLTDRDGEPMILVTTGAAYCDALTGQAI